MEWHDENGRKLQQSGGAGSEEYTHGGVKKTKFEPKAPTRRLKKLSAVKGEPEAGGLPPAVVPKELQRLLQQVESHGRARDRPNQRTSKVAFGFTGAANPGAHSRSAGFQRAGPVGGVGTSGAEGVGGVRGQLKHERGGGGHRRVLEKEEFLEADGDLMHAVEVKNGEVFDYEKYYPLTLPLRRPGGDAARLDEEEFGEEVGESDESGAEAARELGLMERSEGDTLFFFQFPKGLPMGLQGASGKEKTTAAVRLEDLGKGGAMGKLQVYESGAVKFKIGNVVFDALPGTECTFAQEVAAVNTTDKYCGFVGEVHKRVVLTPDITDVLPDLTDLRTKP